MVDLVDENRDGSQKDAQTNSTTPKRTGRTVAAEPDFYGYPTTYIAEKHPQSKFWPDGTPLTDRKYREVIRRANIRRVNQYQVAYSHHNIPKEILERMTSDLMVYVCRLNWGFQPTDPLDPADEDLIKKINMWFEPVPPSGMDMKPRLRPRPISFATIPVERSLQHQAGFIPPIWLHDLDYREADEILEGMNHIANISSSRAVAAGTIPPPLPPSVEEAYKKKCIELKRRMQEVEESNDVFRVRKARLARGIRKMRLERAYLLEMLGKRMKKNGSSVDGFPQPYDEESDGSSEGPPTVVFPLSSPSTSSCVKSLANLPSFQPHEKPLRSKRSHRRPVSSPPPNFGHQHPRPIAPSQAHPASAYEAQRDGFRESAFQHVPTTNGHAAIHYPPHPSTYPPNTAYQPEPQVMRPRPQPPQSAFFSFLEGYVQRHPEKYPHQTQDELLQVAHRAWEETEAEEYKHYYEDKYQRELRAYEEQIAELERREREGMMEVQGPPPPPPQAQQPRETPAGVGGFTSING